MIYLTVIQINHLTYMHFLLQNKLGGGEGVVGMYGSITQPGMQKVLDALRLYASMTHLSTLVDIGSGLGR
jgi:hypothetical protein